MNSMNTKKLNILLFSNTKYNPEFPARTEIIEIFGGIFPKLGHKITWICPGNMNHTVKTKFNEVDLYIVPSIPYKELKSFIVKGYNIISHSLKKINLINNLIRTSNIDIIQTRDNIFDWLIALIIKKTKKIPFVFQMNFIHLETNLDYDNNSILLRLYKNVTRLILKYIIKKADLILPISEYIRNYLLMKKLNGSKIVTMPMGVNYKTFFPNNGIEEFKNKFNLDGNIIYIYVGTMAKKRNLDVIIRAFFLVKKEIENVKLLMVGDGDGKEELEQISIELNLVKEIIFTGKVPYSEIPQYICLADIGLSPIVPIDNYIMSSPTKVLEYLACGIPVVGNREILDMRDVISKSKGGILVDFDAESFADGMKALARSNQQKLNMGEDGRKWVINNRSYKEIANNLEKRYYELLSER